MTWPVPETWSRTAKASVKKKADELLRRKKKLRTEADSVQPIRDREPVYEFETNQFREKFYQIIGHHNVLDLRDNATDPTGKTYTRKQFCTELGISETQLGRWVSEKTFVDANTFFAFQLLVLQKPLAELRLSSNPDILERVTLSTFHYLARVYDHPVAAKITRDELVFLIKLMSLMFDNRDTGFNPHESKRKTENRAALTRLAELLLNPASRVSDEVKKQRIEDYKHAARTVLTRWGLAYSLYALGCRKKWPRIGANS